MIYVQNAIGVLIGEKGFQCCMDSKIRNKINIKKH